MWEKIFKKLQEKGFEVYPPATKKGECTKPYVVVKNNGLSRHTSISSNMEYYDVLCYVPQNKYSTLETYKNSVKKALKELYPMIKEGGTETPSYYDDKYKAHMISVLYVNYKKK